MMTAWRVLGQATMYCHVPVCFSKMVWIIGSMVMGTEELKMTVFAEGWIYVVVDKFREARFYI